MYRYDNSQILATIEYHNILLGLSSACANPTSHRSADVEDSAAAYVDGDVLLLVLHNHSRFCARPP